MVNTISRFKFFSFIILLIISPVTAQTEWCGVNTLYFQHQNSPDITTYEQLINYPSGAPETDESVTVKASDGLKLIDTYISPDGSPGSSSLLKGLRRYRTFHYVDKAAGTTKINFTPFIRYTNGTEKVLYTVATDDINDLTVNEYLTSYVSPVDFNFSVGDRFGIRVYAKTDQQSNVVVHWVYEGSYHYSSVESGSFVCPALEYVPVISMPDDSLIMSIVGGFIGGLIVIMFYRRKRK